VNDIIAADDEDFNFPFQNEIDSLDLQDY